MKKENKNELISKIKILSAHRTEIELEGEEVSDSSKTTKTTSISSDDVRHPDFDAVGVKMIPWIRKMFDFPKDWEIEFKSVTIKRNDGFAVNIGIYVRYSDKFSGGSAIPLPLLVDESKNGLNKLPIQLYDLIINLIEEAQAFAFEGKKAQGNLGLDDKEKTDEELEEEEKLKLVPPGRTQRIKKRA